MTDKERLTNIIHNAQNKYLNLLKFESSILADYLLANGVIVPPCKVGDVVYTLCGERYFDDNGVEWERLTGKMHIEERQFSLGMMDENYNLHSAYFLTKEEAEAELQKRGENNA